MNKIKFNFNKKSAKKILFVFLKYKYLLFLILFSALLGFIFSVTYKYAYVNIMFIEYEESYESSVILNMKKGNRTLKKILTNTKEREKEFEMSKDKKYNNPFKFRKPDVLENKKSDIINSEVENNPRALPTIETENGTIN